MSLQKNAGNEGGAIPALFVYSSNTMLSQQGVATPCYIRMCNPLLKQLLDSNEKDMAGVSHNKDEFHLWAQK
jgi:hypothetical protein